MFEKVNPSHPDKLADRIAGALVDYVYLQKENPKIAVEVLLGHGDCHVIAETSVHIPLYVVTSIVDRICTSSSPMLVDYKEIPQDPNLAKNQDNKIRCGDNGIFMGAPKTQEQNFLSSVARKLYTEFPFDGKYLINSSNYLNYLTICQSHFNSAAETDQNIMNKIITSTLEAVSLSSSPLELHIKINPIGDWVGGPNVDCGATNRKLGSDMGDAITGGGLHGKDLSKGDVSINIYAFLKAQEQQKNIYLSCYIGSEVVDAVDADGAGNPITIPYSDIVEIARKYIKNIGGFEKFAEWGLI